MWGLGGGASGVRDGAAGRWKSNMTVESLQQNRRRRRRDAGIVEIFGCWKTSLIMLCVED